jgi:ribosomal protein L14
MKVISKKRWGVFLFEDNAGIMVNSEGERNGSVITGPVAKEQIYLWSRTASNAGVIVLFSRVFVKKIH